MPEFDSIAWIDRLASELRAVFKDRLCFVGIQGSRARGEARADSDIDSVVLIQDLSVADIATYREVLSSMPHNDLACGFIGSPEVLASWPRYDAFNLVMDTKPVVGTFDFMDTSFSADDAMQSARAGASEIYHAIGHTIAFEPDALSQTVGACIKSAFFIMRALCFANTNEYPNSRQRMKELATDEERLFLDAYDSESMEDHSALAKALFEWSGRILEDGHRSLAAQV